MAEHPVEWLAENATVPLFAHADVLELTGTAHQTLQNWANRGLVKPAADKPGRAGRRLYSPSHLVQIELGRLLESLGITASVALGQGLAIWAEYLRAFAAAVTAGEARTWNDVVETWAVVEPPTPAAPIGTVSIHRMPNVPFEKLFRSHPVIVFPFGPAVFNLAERACALATEREAERWAAKRRTGADFALAAG